MFRHALSPLCGPACDVCILGCFLLLRITCQPNKDFKKEFVLLTGSWGLLRPSWSLLEHSWMPLGASLGTLGGVLGPLGRLLARLGGAQNITDITCPKKINFQTPKCRILRGYGGGFGKPKSIKNGPKTSQNLRRFSRAKKLLFKSLLEPAWADLGAFWKPS